jgi:antitoxin SocA-like protein
MRSRIDSALSRLNFGEKKRSDARLRELILYIADKSVPDECYGAIKLNKILYFSDFGAYLERGKPITGTEYMGLPQGPVPRRFVTAREHLLGRGDIVVRKQPFKGKVQDRIIALRDANLDLFTGWEVSYVDEVIARFWGRPAREMSALSHDRVWRLAGTEKGAIPYQAVFISDDAADIHDAARLRRLMAKHGSAARPAQRVR